MYGGMHMTCCRNWARGKAVSEKGGRALQACDRRQGMAFSILEAQPTHDQYLEQDKGVGLAVGVAWTVCDTKRGQREQKEMRKCSDL